MFIAVVTTIQAAAAGFPPNFRADANLHSARLRADILARPSCDKQIPPTSNRSATGSDFSGSGTDVFMQVRFFKVQTVEAALGTMQLKVWMRMQWVDTRLAWDPADYGNITTTFFQAMNYAGAEENEIWVPDIQPYNAAQGIQRTLDASQARVSSKGEVFWSRPGTLEMMQQSWHSTLLAAPSHRRGGIGAARGRGCRGAVDQRVNWSGMIRSSGLNSWIDDLPSPSRFEEVDLNGRNAVADRQAASEPAGAVIRPEPAVSLDE